MTPMAVAKVSRHQTRKITRRPAAPAQHKVFEDQLAVEEPLEIRVHDEPVWGTMRTPGDDFALAAGFLHADGLLRSSREIGSLCYVGDPRHPQIRNVVNLTYASGHKPDLERLRRRLHAAGPGGIGGKAAIERIKVHAKPALAAIRVRLEVLYGMGHSLRKARTFCEKSGGLHAAGIFDEHGVLHVLHEDVGRQNAVDKAVGHMLLQERVPLDHHILMVSGRACFEILQRAVMAHMPMVCAVSAPTSLAVETAREFGVTLVGFLREDDFNVYTHAERIEV